MDEEQREEYINLRADFVTLIAHAKAIVKWAEEKQRQRAEPWQRNLVDMLKPELDRIDKKKYF